MFIGKTSTWVCFSLLCCNSWLSFCFQSCAVKLESGSLWKPLETRLLSFMLLFRDERNLANIYATNCNMNRLDTHTLALPTALVASSRLVMKCLKLAVLFDWKLWLFNSFLPWFRLHRLHLKDLFHHYDMVV